MEKINLIESESISEQVESLKNKKSNIAGGNFSLLSEYQKDIDYSNPLHTSNYTMAIRYENTVDEMNLVKFILQ